MELLLLPVALITFILLGFPVVAFSSRRSGQELAIVIAKSFGWALLAGFVWVLFARGGAATPGSEAASLALAAEGFFVWGLVGCAPGAGLLAFFARQIRRNQP